MRKTKNRMSVFYDGYRERNPVKWVRRLFWHWKWAYQRATRGYCDADTWNLYAWFLALMPEMLDQMAAQAHGFPSMPNDGTMPNTQALMTGSEDDKAHQDGFEAWQETLRTMAAKFRDADEETCSRKNKYEDEWSRAYDEFHEKYGFFGCELEKKAFENKDSTIRAHFPGEFPQWKDVMDRHREEELKLAKYRHQCLEEGLEMFKTWFWNLWD